jgi:hypothetical protein
MTAGETQRPVDEQLEAIADILGELALTYEGSSEDRRKLLGALRVLTQLIRRHSRQLLPVRGERHAQDG